MKTTNETKQVGTTLEAKSETKAETPSGTVKSKTETIVGTVTVFTAGKTIEVMTGEKKMHSFNLDDTDVTYSVDGNVRDAFIAAAKTRQWDRENSARTLA